MSALVLAALPARDGALAAGGPSYVQVASEAAAVGVCARPVMRTVSDAVTGRDRLVGLACGSTRAAVCPACAEKARALRMHQCREGWHVVDDPVSQSAVERAERDERSQVLLDAARAEREAERAVFDAALGVVASVLGGVPIGVYPPPGRVGRAGQSGGNTLVVGGRRRRVRSTARPVGMPDLPRVRARDMRANTSGTVFTCAKTGKVHRPSMFITLTLPSYGAIARDGAGSAGYPVNPGAYDYRRAAMDAVHFPKILDRFFQNLRRGAGYAAQYFAAVEPQARLAAHAHIAVRGAISRDIVRQVIAGTFVHVWWPAHGRDDRVPVSEIPQWDGALSRYVNPVTNDMAPFFDFAADAAEVPAHTMTFGKQADIKGLGADQRDTQKTIRYLCKYLTKDMGNVFDPGDGVDHDVRYLAHMNRLYQELQEIPCSPRCPNWLLYGIAPRGGCGMEAPGQCGSKAHDREFLGLGGRRVLVSRRWSGKTLAHHKADRRAVVLAALEESGIDPDQPDYAQSLPDGTPRYHWQAAYLSPHEYVNQLRHHITTRNRQRIQYHHARTTPARAGPPADNHSAISIPRKGA